MAEAAFESRTLNVAALLGEDQKAQIIVPPFQRGYSWDKRHLEAFWKDVMMFLDQASEKGGPDKYFLGPIVVMYKLPETIELLDGQQRIATATILFAALRDAARSLNTQAASDFGANIQSRFIQKRDADGEDVGKYSLVMGELDRSYFVANIQSEGTPTKAKLRSNRNIEFAKQFMKEKVSEKLAGMDDPKTRLAWLNRLKLAVQRDLVMACIPVASERDAFMIFETLNDRGLRLSTPDLFLNYLMRQAADDGTRKQIRDLWNEMLEQMGRRDINRFLRHLWVSKYGDLKKVDLFTALKDKIEKHHADVLEFAQTCAFECARYMEILNVEKEIFGDEIARNIDSLVRRLDFQTSYPVLLSAHGSFSVSEFGKIVKWLLVFVARYSIIGHLDPSGPESVLFTLAREIRTRMAGSEDEKKAATAPCLTHIKDKLIANAPSDDDTERAAAKLTVRPDDAGYLLSRLANFVQSPTKEVEIAETNLEHVFPKKPKQNEWGGPDGHERLEPYLWHLGNLTIYGKRLNHNTANAEYDVKRSDYANKTEVRMTKQIAQDFTEWNEGSIERRAASLAKMATRVWNFDNPSRV